MLTDNLREETLSQMLERELIEAIGGEQVPSADADHGISDDSEYADSDNSQGKGKGKAKLRDRCRMPARALSISPDDPDAEGDVDSSFFRHAETSPVGMATVSLIQLLPHKPSHQASYPVGATTSRQASHSVGASSLVRIARLTALKECEIIGYCLQLGQCRRRER
jgi:hypothetical protein